MSEYSGKYLWTPATQKIDFGDGVKVRIKNTTHVLKGVFYRTDSLELRTLESLKQDNERLTSILDQAGATRSPLTSECSQFGVLGARIMDLRRQVAEAKRETESARMQWSNSQRELGNCVKDLVELRKTVVERAKDGFFAIVECIAESKVR